MLSEAHLKNVCLLWGGHKQCRYLERDDMDWNKYYCKKKSVDKDIIDQEVDKFVKEQKALGKNPRSLNEPLGDNCKGFLPLTSLLQGYDI